MPETIGFIGLGNMGKHMAANLLAAGFGLRVYNRTPEKARELVEKGAVLAKTPAETATKGGIVVTMVVDDRALEAVATDDFARALGQGGLHISMSTVSPRTSEKLAEHHSRFGASFATGPVFGRPEAAAAGKLWVCASGAPAAKERATPIWNALGQGIFDFGEAVGAANVVKLGGNFLLTAAIEAMAELSAMVEKNGIPRKVVLDFLTRTLFNCPIYNLYAGRLIAADFEKVGFAARVAYKDMNLAQQTAAQAQAPMPIVDLLCDRYLTAMAQGRGEMDATVLAEGAARDAGLKW